jgi:hypothetical protein
MIFINLKIIDAIYYHSSVVNSIYFIYNESLDTKRCVRWLCHVVNKYVNINFIDQILLSILENDIIHCLYNNINSIK